MQRHHNDHIQGSAQKFLPLRQLYENTMAYAQERRKDLTDPVPEDDVAHSTRLRKQRYAEYVEYCHEKMRRMVPRIDAFIAGLPALLAEAEAEQGGPEETWVIRSVQNCTCMEKSVSCAGHIFELDQVFVSATTFYAPSITTPYTPQSPASPSEGDAET